MSAKTCLIVITSTMMVRSPFVLIMKGCKAMIFRNLNSGAEFFEDFDVYIYIYVYSLLTYESLGGFQVGSGLIQTWAAPLMPSRSSATSLQGDRPVYIQWPLTR